MATKNIKELFLVHRREVQAYLAKKLRDTDAAADLTQETFLRFTEQLQDNPATIITHERSYLYRTAHNLAIDHVRRQQREKLDTVDDEVLLDIADEAPTPEQIANGQTELEVVQRAMAELPERTRQIFTLVRIEGLSYREVATRLDISDSSVQKHVAKAIKQVMHALRET